MYFCFVGLMKFTYIVTVSFLLLLSVVVVVFYYCNFVRFFPCHFNCLFNLTSCGYIHSNLNGKGANFK